MSDTTSLHDRLARPMHERQARRSLDGKVYAPEIDNELNLLFARTFGTADGQRVVAYLRNITLNVAFEGDVAGSELMHMEGQRWLVGLIVKRTAEGNKP